MNIPFGRSVSLFGSFCFLLGCGIQSTETDLIPEAVKESVRKRVEVGKNVGIVVGVIRDGRKSTFSFGTTSSVGHQPVTQGTVFEIGSISKAFTGVALSLEAQRGGVRLGDPIDAYLPDGVTPPSFNGKPVRLIHLATHSGGLSRAPSNLHRENPENPYADYGTAETFTFVNGLTLPYEPGVQYAYSNVGMGFLGDLLAGIHHTDYEGLLREGLFEPLGMDQTFVSWEGFTGDRAFGHRLGTAVSDYDFMALSGAGGIRSNVSDLLRFLEVNLNPPETAVGTAIRLAQIPRGETDDPDLEIGLGWHILNSKGHRVIWHNGTTGGFSGFLGFVPELGLGVVVLTNSAGGADDLGWFILGPLAELSDVKRPIALELHRALEVGGPPRMIERLEKIISDEKESYEVGYPELKRVAYSFLQDDCATSIEIFKRTVKVYPEVVDGYLSLGEAFYTCGKADSAVSAVNQALELDPDNPVAGQLLQIIGSHPFLPT